MGRISETTGEEVGPRRTTLPSKPSDSLEEIVIHTRLTLGSSWTGSDASQRGKCSHQANSWRSTERGTTTATQMLWAPPVKAPTGKKKIHSPCRAIDLGHEEDVGPLWHSSFQVILNKYLLLSPRPSFDDTWITLVARALKWHGQQGPNYSGMRVLLTLHREPPRPAGWKGGESKMHSKGWTGW